MLNVIFVFRLVRIVGKDNRLTKSFSSLYHITPGDAPGKERLYKLARRDIFVYLKPVKIEILEIKLISMIANELSIKVRCHKGTYIRQLGNDIAKSLGTIGYLKTLTRTGIGEYTLENSIPFKEIDC